MMMATTAGLTKRAKNLIGATHYDENGKNLPNFHFHQAFFNLKQIVAVHLILLTISFARVPVGRTRKSKLSANAYSISPRPANNSISPDSDEDGNMTSECDRYHPSSVYSTLERSEDANFYATRCVMSNQPASHGHTTTDTPPTRKA